MKYDYFLQVGKEETKYGSKKDALIKAFELVKEDPKKDVILFSKCRGERIDTIPSIKKYIEEGGTVDARPKKAKVVKEKIDKDGEVIVKPVAKGKFAKKMKIQEKMAAEKPTPKKWVEQMGLTVRPKTKE